jgi:hypothetical protein
MPPPGGSRRGRGARARSTPSRCRPRGCSATTPTARDCCATCRPTWAWSSRAGASCWSAPAARRAARCRRCSTPGRARCSSPTAAPAKATALAAAFAAEGPVAGAGLDAAHGPFDLVVNATSASLAGDVPALPDDVIGPRRSATTWLTAARRRPSCAGRRARPRGRCRRDGIGMLVEQAAESFDIMARRAPRHGAGARRAARPHRLRLAPQRRPAGQPSGRPGAPR